jgi:hypothetical protein
MKGTSKFALAILMALPLFGQSSRQVVLTWEDALNPAGTTYSILRASGQCAGATGFVKLASGLTPKTYTDSVPPGLYCYQATATFNSLESDPATVETKAKPYSPSKFSVTVTVTVTAQ